MLGEPRQIRDDRGVERPVVRSELTPAVREAMRRLPPVEDNRLGGLRLALGVITALLLLAGCCAVSPGPEGVVVVLIGGIALALALVRRLSPATQDSSRRISLAAWIVAGVCPGCGYALSGLREAEDGCVECPECGAAWAAGRWRRDHPPFRTDLFEGVEVPADAVACWATDARGRSFNTYPLTPEPKELARARRRGLMALAISGAAVALAAVFLLLTQPREVAAIALVIIAGALGLAALEVRHGELIASRKRRMKEQVAQGECPRCLGVLPEVGAVSDGARVCGQCGAAWAGPGDAAPGSPKA